MFPLKKLARKELRNGFTPLYSFKIAPMKKSLRTRGKTDHNQATTKREPCIYCWDVLYCISMGWCKTAVT